MPEEPAVAVVIVTHDSKADVLRCLEALLSSAHLALEVVVVDNASVDGGPEAVAERFPRVKVARLGSNQGFGAANNRGFGLTGAPLVLVLNPDTELGPGALEGLVAVLDRHADVGVVGPRTVYPDGAPQVSWGPDLTPLSEWRQRRLVRGVRLRKPWALQRTEAGAQREFRPDWVSASCMLVRRTALDAVRGFDEGFFLYEEDADLCLRMRQAGFGVMFTPAVEIVHRLGTAMARAPRRARLEYERSHLRYYEKHNGPLARAFLRARLLGAGAWGLGRALFLGDPMVRAHSRDLLRLALGQARDPHGTHC